MSFVNDAKVFSLFSSTNARIYQAFVGIDHIITHAAACGNPIKDAAGKPMSATWGSAYKAWMTTFVAGQNALVAHTASVYSAAIPTNDPAHGQFIDSFNQRYGAASSLTFPVPQIWPNSPLTMQKRDADCTPTQPITASPTFATSSPNNTQNPSSTLAVAIHPPSTPTPTNAKITQPTTASPTIATSSSSNSSKPKITPAASLSSSTTPSPPATATTPDQDDRICDNEATGKIGPCDQVGGIMIGHKSSSTGPVPSAAKAKPAPKGQDPQICENPSAAEAGPCAAAGIKNGTTGPGTTFKPNTTLTGSSSNQSPLPSVLTMQRGGPQGGVVVPPPTPAQDSGDSGSGDEKPCDPGSPLEFLCWL